MAKNNKQWVDSTILVDDLLGAANGVAQLDGSGKIPASQLPTSVQEYKGAWDASTNTPNLADGAGTAGDTYRVSVAGTLDLGSGSEDYNVGDLVIYSGTIWEKTPEDTSLVGKTTDDLNEGLTNLYHTQARVRTSTLDGFVAGSNSPVVAADSVLAGLEKLQGQINNIPAGISQLEEVITLTGTDISNGFVTLSNTPIANTVSCFPVGGPMQEPLVDFAVVGAQFSFLGDLVAELGSGDKIVVAYSY